MKTIIMLVAVLVTQAKLYAPVAYSNPPKVDFVVTKPEPRVYKVIATVMTSKTGGARLANGKKNDANTNIFVALPCKSALGKKVTVFVPETGIRLHDIPVLDVGPWSTKDPYWKGNKRPLAESYKSDKYKHTKNRAAIDLSLALCKSLGLKYPYKGAVEWSFE